MYDDEEAVQLYQEAIPHFYASVFVYADADALLNAGFALVNVICAWVALAMRNALLHLELEFLGTSWFLTELAIMRLGLLHIIQAMCNDGNIEGATLMLEEKMAEVHGFLIQHERFREIQEEI
jgi:hypothetical protein